MGKIRFGMMVLIGLGMLSASRAEYLWNPGVDPTQDGTEQFAFEPVEKKGKGMVTNVSGRVGMELSHKEWMIIGLMRADFKLAARHARHVAVVTPKDVKANFALGMAAYFDRDFVVAERHLRRCYRCGTSIDPAVLNNLALAQMFLGKYKDALQHIDIALARYPDIPDLKKTQGRILVKMHEEETKRQEQQKAEWQPLTFKGPDPKAAR